MIATRIGRVRLGRVAWLVLAMFIVEGDIFCGSQRPVHGGEPNRVVMPAGSDSGSLRWVRRGASSDRGTAQHSLAVAESIHTSAKTSVATGPAPTTVLRWRTSDVAQTQPAQGRPIAPAHFVTTAKPARVSYPVRQAAAMELDLPAAIPDAFADPFEDGTRDPAPPLVDPTPIPVPPRVELQPVQSVPQAVHVAMWEDDPPPQLRGNAAPQQLPPPQNESVLRQQACDRIHNRRDCCADAEHCREARDQWGRDAISKIGLDISPSMHPDKPDPVTQEEARNRDLAESPARTWRDRQNNVLATGRLNNVQRGKVLVLDENNQVARIPMHELSDDDLCFLTAWWRVPSECTFGEEQFAPRQWAPSTLTWKASALCHKPLYFEEVQLERYGHTAGPIKQPLLSGAHFFANLVTMPYQAGINPPGECQYALGYYRPGSCAPWLVPPIPLSVRGGLWQAGAVVGGVILFP